MSDIHFDLRPAFATAGLGHLIDVFTLSFEQGVQKPDPSMFTRTLAALDVDADEGLMIGDRSRPTAARSRRASPRLLLPPLRRTTHRRLHHVTALCGVA